MQSLVNKVRMEVCSRFFIDYNPYYESSIFLAGIGRSGTTWVSDIINHKNEYRYMFEPFHPYKVDVCKRFKYKQYLRPDNKDSYFLEAAKLILSGTIRNRWIDSQNKKILSRKRLIKDIRANLMLKWVHSNFPGIPIILLFRHPCAIACSRIKKNWDPHLELFLSQVELMEDHLNPFRREIDRAQNIFEKNIFLWCIEYYVPLRQLTKSEVYLAFYEEFCQNLGYQKERLFNFLGKESDHKNLAKLRRPSVTSREDSAIISGLNLIDSWRKDITKTQLQRAIEILKLFGLDSIYSDESMPHMTSSNELYSDA